MSNITWERRHEAFKAIHDRIAELLGRFRIDIVSLGGGVSPNNAGVQVVAGVEGQRVKVYDAGYHAAVDGLHFFYFGTSTTATTKRFCTANLKGLVHKTFVQPRVGDVGDGLYLFSGVAEVNMPYDVGYVQEV